MSKKVDRKSSNSGKKVDRGEMWRLLKQTWPYVRDSKRSLVMYIVLALIEAGLGVALPIMSAQLILHMTAGKMQQLIYAALAVALMMGILQALQYLKMLFYQKVYRRTTINLQVAVARAELSTETNNIDRSSSGVFMDRLSKDTSEMSTIFSDYAFYLSKVTSNAGVLVSLFVLNKYLFIWAVLSAFVVLWINQVKIHKQYVARKEMKRLQERRTSLANEMIRGIRDAKALNSTDELLSRTKERVELASSQEFKALKIGRAYTLLTGEFRTVNSVIFILLGCWLYSVNLLTIPTFVIVYNFRNKVQELLTGLAYIADINKQFVLAASRVYEIIGNNDKFKKETFGDVKLSKLEGDITFRDVHFGYDKDREILKGINFHIHPNERVAFVGRSGAGKTTLFNLITRMYHANSGEILLDGHEIETLTRDSIRNNMSIITQNPYIFNFSIKENLLLAKPKASLRQIRKACQLACIDDYIMSLPDQYDTMVGENGVILSGGQRQRLAIARALLKKTEVILFDEATSALDNETQAQIQQAIANLQGEYTILIVAHRLSTIVDSDRIFVIDGGRIVAEGTHKQLFKTCEFYKELYSKDLEK